MRTKCLSLHPIRYTDFPSPPVLHHIKAAVMRWHSLMYLLRLRHRSNPSRPASSLSSTLAFAPPRRCHRPLPRYLPHQRRLTGRRSRSPVCRVLSSQPKNSYETASIEAELHRSTKRKPPKELGVDLISPYLCTSRSISCVPSPAESVPERNDEYDASRNDDDGANEAAGIHGCVPLETSASLLPIELVQVLI